MFVLRGKILVKNVLSDASLFILKDNTSDHWCIRCATLKQYWHCWSHSINSFSQMSTYSIASCIRVCVDLISQNGEL